MRFMCAAVLALAAAISGAALAHDAKLADLTIHHPWARASIGPAKAGAAYLTIVNAGADVDRLIGVETPAAKMSETHTNIMDQGVMKMRPVEAVEVQPGEPVIFQPGGLHIMLMGLKAPLKEGETFPLTLRFEKSGSIEVEVTVEKATTMAPRLEHGHGAGS